MNKRICILCIFTFFCLWALSLRLYFLSGNRNPSLDVLEGQYTTRLDITSRSGFIYDRYFNLLSHDEYTGILVINPAECENFSSLAREVSKLSRSFKESEISEKLFDGIPFTLTVTNLEAARRFGEKTEGVYFFRSYKENFSTAEHLLGYSREEKGITGLRRACNSYLYEKLRAEAYAVYANDAKRGSMSELQITDECSEKDGLILTLDKKLQLFTDGLSDFVKSGCVIVADGENGEILALSSFPEYDVERLGEYLNSDRGELLNKALCSFTPGSVFKLVVAAAALEADPKYADYTVDCAGSILSGNHYFGCHKRSGHGELDMKEAFALSCNCYFISLAKEIGYGAAYETACRLGLNKAKSIDLLRETGHSFLSGSEPNEETLANLSIGQGELCLSPLDLLTIIQGAATGGITPFRVILGRTENGKNHFRTEQTPERVFSAETANALCDMMEECVKNGTGKAAKIDGVTMGGKTATAQTGRFDENGVEYVHKWFCGFCDGTEKRYIFCVLFDNTKDRELSPTVVSGKICSFLKENGY